MKEVCLCAFTLACALNVGMMSMPGSKVKWEAWEACKGMSKEAAMKAYVDAINEWKSKG